MFPDKISILVWERSRCIFPIDYHNGSGGTLLRTCLV